MILTGILADIGGVRLLSWWGLLSGSSMLGTGLLMVWGSRVGKRQLATRTIEGLALGGGERILDVGCGHGLLSIAAAKKLATGRAFGVDIWSERDQADNRPAVTLRNADLEGVRDRVRLCEGDARALPFPDASFDVVVSSLAIHNIARRTERMKALQEIARVVRPTGRILIIDIARTAEYARALRDARFGEIRRPGRRLTLTVDHTSYWRQSVHDGLYGIAVNLVRRAGQSRSRDVGCQLTVQADVRADGHLTFGVTVTAFLVGRFLRETGPGRNVRYAAVNSTYRF